MAGVYRHGSTVVVSKVIGKKTRRTLEVHLFMLMGIFMKASGLMIRHIGMVFIITLMVLSMKATGKKISKRGLERKHGKMGLALKEIIRTVRSQE
jgi:hypothetical protein